MRVIGATRDRGPGDVMVIRGKTFDQQGLAKCSGQRPFDAGWLAVVIEGCPRDRSIEEVGGLTFLSRGVKQKAQERHRRNGDSSAVCDRLMSRDAGDT